MNKMNFKYGVSYNCKVEGREVGGGAEGCTTLDFVSNSLAALYEALTNDSDYVINDTNHRLIGRSCNIGGDVIAVLGEWQSDSFYVNAVVFTDPELPTIVKED